MRGKPLLILAGLLLVMGSSYGLEKYCADNNTLLVNSTYSFCIDDGCTNQSRFETVICNFGCNFEEGECYYSNASRETIAGAVGVGVLFLLLILKAVFG